MDFNEEEGTDIEQVVNMPGISSGVDVSISYNYNTIINFAILIIIFLLAKFIFKRFLLSKKAAGSATQNFAYSISVFSLFVSLALILTSVIYGDMPINLNESVLKLIVYSVLGIALLLISGFIFDKISIAKISINSEIAKGNNAAGIVDAGNFIASALIITATLKWYEFKSFEGITAILSMYACSQVILTIATLARKFLFRYPDKSVNFEQQIYQNNEAAAIDFAGRRIATALAITAATNLLPFQENYNLTDVLINWIIISTAAIVFLNILSWIASKIILSDRNIQNDILNKNNATALSDAAIYISFGIILTGTLI